ncbi:hypothetical protein [Uliginosibacterium sediminicola]|uniref:DUF2149 domain-containing protein n=1 Tax=Uliginosibacterium sediminicola TaxID=2024550 RepID=A0ABU9YXW9_9RHOO
MSQRHVLANQRRRLRTRFDGDDEDPRASLVNLVDVMLVFACGLLAAISHTQTAQQAAVSEVSRVKALPEATRALEGGAEGYLSVGKVYRDPKTGKLILVEQP